MDSPLLELPVSEELLPDPTLGLLLPEVLLPGDPALGELLPEVLLPLRAASARSAATQSSNAMPVIPTQRERSEDVAVGPVSEVPEAEDELGDDALGDVALPVESGDVVLPVVPVCASTTPLVSALAARIASAFRGKCFIKDLHW